MPCRGFGRVILIVSVVSIAAFIAAGETPAQNQFGEVSLVVGDAEIRPTGSLGWEPVSIGKITSTGDRVRTQQESQVELATVGGGRVVIGENASVSLGSPVPPTAGGSTRMARLLVGVIFCDVRPTGDISVETPTSVCAVRGTAFALDALMTGRTLCLVGDGVVVFRSRAGGEVEIRAGQASVVEPGRPPTPPRPMTDAERMQYENIAGRPPVPEPAPAPEQPAPEQPIPAAPTPAPAPPEQVPPTIEPEKPAEVEEAEEEKVEERRKPAPRKGAGMGIEMGAVDIEGKTYKQISLRPELSFGKIGIGLDLPIYFDENGSVRKQDWDEAGDYLDKIYYVRFGAKGDPFYIKAGALDRVTLGYGLIMDGYSNTVQYPDVRKSGIEFGLGGDRFGINAMVANLRELDEPGLVGGRAFVRPVGSLEFGATFVMDGNQYAGMFDSDGDGYPDIVDDLPHYAGGRKDTDGDGFDDSEDMDADNDGELDATWWFETLEGQIVHGPDTNLVLKPEPFHLSQVDDSRKKMYEFGLDIGYPLVNRPGLRLDVYSEFARIDGYGSGMVLPGARVISGPLAARLELRHTSREFLTGYFSRTYDLERAVYNAEYDPPLVTKKEALEKITQEMRGVFGSVELNLLNIVTGGIAYEHLSGDGIKDRNLMGTLSIDTQLIPQISQAEAYYINKHIPEGESLLKLRSERTVMGFIVAYAMGSNADLVVSYRETYRDRNGDGKIDRETETIKTTNLGTRIRF